MRSGKNLFAQEAKRSLEFGLTMMQLKDFDELLLLRNCGWLELAVQLSPVGL